MTRDDIIRMAQEAGFAVDAFPDAAWIALMGRFASLVAAAEREQCHDLCCRFAARDMHPAECAAAIRLRGNK